MARIQDSVKNIIEISRKDGIPTNVAADGLALERLRAGQQHPRLTTTN